jgi:two-component system chemotaxis response regulator CheY
MTNSEHPLAKTILVVDDSTSLRQVVKMALTSVGYEVIEAADGKAALGLLDGRTVCMAICDVNMPVLNGIEFVKAVKQLPQYKFMPIMMLTTESQEASREQGKAAGARRGWLSLSRPCNWLRLSISYAHKGLQRESPVRLPSADACADQWH